jgi:hypothetical protein
MTLGGMVKRGLNAGPVMVDTLRVETMVGVIDGKHGNFYADLYTEDGPTVAVTEFEFCA